MNTLLATLFILSALAPQTQPQTISIDVVFVVPASEELTQDEQATTLASVSAAAAWWNELAPITTTLVLGQTRVVTTSADVLNDLTWSLAYLADPPSRITLFVIDNSSTQILLFGDSAGEAQDYYQAIWVVLKGIPGPHGMSATIAHELGHVHYGLPDLMSGTDIMNHFYPASAYQQRFVGCQSLKTLGRPCVLLWLPEVKA